MQASMHSVLATSCLQPPRAASIRPFTAASARRGKAHRSPVLCASSPAPVHRLSCASHAGIYGLPPTAARWQRAPLAAPAARRSMLVRASWGAPVEFSKAKLVNNTKATDKLHKLVVDVGDLAAGYVIAGQFLQLKVDESSKPGFFAIASPPDPNNQGLLELLVKAQGDAAVALCALPAGAEVLASPVMGKGFQVDKLPASTTPTLLLFATGSGISPVRALIESGALSAGERPDVRLYYGTRDAASAAYTDLLPSWEALGVKVIQVFSGDAAGDGKGRYVQDEFAATKQLPSDPSGVGVVLCGQKEMVNAVKEILAQEGVPAEKVLLNF